MTADISVVIPVRDQEQFVGAVCMALELQTLEPTRFEVIFVNDGSKDASREILEAWVSRDPVRRRVLTTNGVGPARAKNTALNVASGEWVAFTDADTIPDRNWLETALDVANENGYDAIEGSIEPWPEPTRRALNVQPSNQTGGRFMGGNMVFRRSLLERLNGFDPSLEQFLEDSDLALRALDTGATIAYVPELRVTHPPVEVGLGQALRRTKRVRWVALFAKKHPQRYRSDFRALVRPISSVDQDVVIGLLAAGTAIRASGAQRAILSFVAAQGIRRGLGSIGAFSASTDQIPTLTALALVGPPLKTFWWAEGCIRFRKLVW
jgi:GT2 family glycosyltransferase